ncbi:MAG: hypothetical protein J6Z79_00900, partial [Clostridia bacterium]|nr:hypothetical protein [Clostridia bacterium]
MTEIKRTNDGCFVFSQNAPVARILPAPDAEDLFEKLEEGLWLWRRRTEQPVDHMRMELVFLGIPDFTMIPGISYNGNGRGNFPEYVGDRDTNGTPWSFASHRCTIPACTYSENDVASVALMSLPNDNSACSLYAVEEGKLHAVIFPEEEKPRTLQRHFWGDAFQGTMEPRQEFIAFIHVSPSDGTRFRYRTLLDVAFRLFGHPVKAPRSADELYRLSLDFCQSLVIYEPDGFMGFSTGEEWHRNGSCYKKHLHRVQLGWVGQNASMAAAFISDYLRSGDKDKLDLAVRIDDAYLRFATLRKGLLASRVDRGKERFFLDPSAEPDPMDWGEDTFESLSNRVRRIREGHPVSV